MHMVCELMADYHGVDPLLLCIGINIHLLSTMVQVRVNDNHIPRLLLLRPRSLYLPSGSKSSVLNPPNHRLYLAYTLTAGFSRMPLCAEERRYVALWTHEPGVEKDVEI